MSKAAIYTSLLETKSLVVKEISQNGENPYTLNFTKSISNPSLFDNITLLIETAIKTKALQFDKICAVSSSAIAYATNVATSFEKGIIYINSVDNDKDDKDNIKNIKIEGEMKIDEKVLLIETIINNDFLVNNIIKKIRKYGGQVVGIILILNRCEGEYVNLVDQKENIINILNIYDIFNHLETNNQIELFYCEKVKFYCERITKLNIKKLLEGEIKGVRVVEAIAPVVDVPVVDVPVVDVPVIVMPSQ